MKTTSQPPLPRRTRSFLPAALMLAVVGFSDLALAVSVRFLPITVEMAERKIGLHDDKGITELNDLNPKKRSKAYACTPGEKPPTLVALDRERPGGNPLSVDIELPADIESALVLILSDAEHRSGMRVIVLEDAATSFPWGGLRFVNTAQKPFMIRCDKDTHAIAESPSKVDLQPGGEARNIGIQLFSEDEPDEIFYSAVWEHSPNLRKLILILPPAEPDAGGITLEIIPQDKRQDGLTSP